MIRIGSIDVIIEKDTLEVIQFMLQYDRQITVCLDHDIFIF